MGVRDHDGQLGGRGARQAPRTAGPARHRLPLVPRERVLLPLGPRLLTRAVAPGICLWGLVAALGLGLTGPLAGISGAEERVNEKLANDRTPSWNLIPLVWSYLGNTESVIGICLFVAGLLLWRTRDWRLAAVPFIAILLQAIIFATVSSLVDRERPLVTELDVSPPTTSHPSGHVGASTGLYVAFALVALQIRHVQLRRLTVGVCLLVPLLVAFARLYRGMHHLTDVLAGILIGVACALLAHGWYRHREQSIAGTATPQLEVPRRQHEQGP